MLSLDKQKEKTSIHDTPAVTRGRRVHPEQVRTELRSPVAASPTVRIMQTVRQRRIDYVSGEKQQERTGCSCVFGKNLMVQQVSEVIRFRRLDGCVILHMRKLFSYERRAESVGLLLIMGEFAHPEVHKSKAEQDTRTVRSDANRSSAVTNSLASEDRNYQHWFLTASGTWLRYHVTTRRHQ